MTTDWLTVSAITVAGIIVGLVFIFSMKRRKEDGDAELRDLEAKRDALVGQLRDLEASPEERKRLELDTANVLRRIDERKVRTKKREERPEALVARHAAIKGFAWGAGSVLVLAGIGWWVTQKAEPKEQAMAPQVAPMQQQQSQPPADAQLQQLQAVVAQQPDNLAIRNELARAYLNRENMMGVFEQTQFVLQKSPNDAQALTYQSLVRMAMGQRDTADAMLHRAIKSDPTFLDAYVALAWEQTTAGKNDEAAKTIAAAAKQHPDQQARLADVLSKMRAQAKAQAAEMPPNHPAVEAPGVAAAAGAAPVDAAPAPAASAPGAIHVTLAMASGKTAPPQGIIYVIARAAGVTAGPPAAVKRLPLSQFPLTFDVSSADSMMGQPLPPKVRLEARIDSDGDAMTHNPNDPVASADNVVAGSTTTLTFH